MLKRKLASWQRERERKARVAEYQNQRQQAAIAEIHRSFEEAASEASENCGRSVSDRQFAANRSNAQKSTGPKTQEGKAKVSQNRTVHGLTGRFQVLEGEDQERFDALVDQLMLDEKPVGLAEIELVKKMAQHMWLSERATRFQEACFLVMPRTPEQLENVEAEIRVRPELERYTRYQAHHDRAYARASAELLKRRKERCLAEIRFESQKRAQAQEQRREQEENRNIERHRSAVALNDKRLEYQEIRISAEKSSTSGRKIAAPAVFSEKMAA